MKTPLFIAQVKGIRSWVLGDCVRADGLRCHSGLTTENLMEMLALHSRAGQSFARWLRRYRRRQLLSEVFLEGPICLTCFSNRFFVFSLFVSLVNFCPLGSQIVIPIFPKRLLFLV